ncbi:hypothetical protein B7486_60865, partial [cyanobacterium TDX16]
MHGEGEAADGMAAALVDARLDPDRFRELADALPIGAVLVDEDGEIAYANEAWRRITGYEGPLPLPLEQALTLVHEDDRDPMLHEMVAGLAGPGRYAGRSRALRPDGEVRWVDMRATLLPAPPGAWAGFAGSLHDVTDLVLAEQATRRSEQRYRDLIEHSPVGQALFDRDGAVLHCNQAYADLYGLSVADLRGVRTLALTHPDDREAIASELRAAMDGELDFV